jgi:hypothetical protein
LGEGPTAAAFQQIFEVDPLACPTCRGSMPFVAFITQTSVIAQILTHLRTRAAREAHAGPRSPPSTRAPASRGTARAPCSSAAPRTAPRARARRRPPVGAHAVGDFARSRRIVDPPRLKFLSPVKNPKPAQPKAALVP